MISTFTILLLLAILVSPTDALYTHRPLLRDTKQRYVFAHIIVGILANRQNSSDWDTDMQRARSVGIDAFALNIGTDSFTDTQLGYAYQSAAQNSMNVFISFDFGFWSTSATTAMGQKIAKYASSPAQLIVDGKPFVSSFYGDGLNVAALRSAVGTPIYFAPNFHPSLGTDLSSVDAAFNWLGWDNDGNNRAATAASNVSVSQGDQQYISALKGKDYMAPSSPWFFTHYGPEVSYSKNWMFPTDLEWFYRWNNLLTLGPRFVEIISWNDYGESHYVGALSAPHTDDGASKWVTYMPHDGWLDMAKPYIAAYKAGATSVSNYITADQLIYWHRPQPRGVDCSATDTCESGTAGGDYYIGPPNGYQGASDALFVVALLRSAGQLQITSGTNSQAFQAPAGASAFSVSMGVGTQQFTLRRNGSTILSGYSPLAVIDGCMCGIYNFNAYVGTIPAGTPDALAPAGMASLYNGLKVPACTAAIATPSSVSSLAPSSVTASATTSSTALASALATKTIIASSLSTAPLPTKTAPSVTNTSAKVTTTSSSITLSSLPGAHSTSTKSTSSSPTPTQCAGGIGANNYIGLCAFACQYGYCPPGPCTCTAYGIPKPTPSSTNVNGVPAPGLDASYLGLCSFDCGHGYCPPTACRAS